MNDNNGGIFFWLIVAGVGFWIYWVGGINVAWYSLRYGVSPEKVLVDTEPRDCNFITAPLGDKGCHYHKVVGAYNATGDLVAGDSAPQYGSDTKTGKPIISHDQGKTWNWYFAAGVPDRKVQKVVVSWFKVND